MTETIKKSIDKQNYLRKEVRLAKACNDDITYKDFADFLEIEHKSFLNWLSGAYNLSSSNERKLHDLVIDLIDYD